MNGEWVQYDEGGGTPIFDPAPVAPAVAWSPLASLVESSAEISRKGCTEGCLAVHNSLGWPR
jgi:hypothetical protein